MSEEKKEKLELRKPLAPTDDNPACRVAYEELLAEYKTINELGVAGIDAVLNEPGVSIDEYNTRVEQYTAKREKYNAAYAGHIETIDMDDEFIVRGLRLEKNMRDNFITTSRLELEFNDVSTYSKEYRDTHAEELKRARDAKLDEIVKKYDSDLDRCEHIWYGKDYEKVKADMAAIQSKYGIE